METCMNPACHTPWQPLQNHPSGHRNAEGTRVINNAWAFYLWFVNLFHLDITFIADCTLNEKYKTYWLTQSCINKCVYHWQDSLLLECWTRDWKAASSNPGRRSGRTFFSRGNFLCWLSFGVCFIPLLPQWHVKDPDHSDKSAGGRLHLDTHAPLTQWSQSGLTMLLSRYSVGTYQEMSSNTTHRLTLGHSRLGSLSHCGLIPALRVELKCAS